MSTQYTPGKRFIETSGDRLEVWEEGGRLIALCGGIHKEVNAALIVAAPDTVAERDRLRKKYGNLLDVYVDLLSACKAWMIFVRCNSMAGSRAVIASKKTELTAIKLTEAAIARTER